MERTTWDQDTRPGESRHDECLTQSAPYKLFALAYNLANFLRTLVLPEEVARWSLTTLREKLIKIGARLVRHGRYLVFQLAEVAVPRALFAAILRRIERLRGPPVPAT
jgi:Transposase DDE domain group 1